MEVVHKFGSGGNEERQKKKKRKRKMEGKQKQFFFFLFFFEKDSQNKLYLNILFTKKTIPNQTSAIFLRSPREKTQRITPRDQTHVF